MIYIENEGALFRGPARGVPLELWDANVREFVPYTFAAQPKDIAWRNVIDETEAERLMAAPNGIVRERKWEKTTNRMGKNSLEG